MQMKKANKKALKHILCCLIILLIFVLTIGVKADTITREKSSIETSGDGVVPLKPFLDEDIKNINNINYTTEKSAIRYDSPRIMEKDINYYILEKEKELKFFSKTFGIDYEYVKKDLLKRSENVENIETTNIASMKNKSGELLTFSSTEYGIVEYFYNLIESNPELRNKKMEPYRGESDYIEKLIIYFTSIYTNVKTIDALSIGAAESGYYKVKYMLSLNNIYGGMSNRGLVRHENIEIGVLRYIRMLSNNYYGKGLTTLESIGRIYCPTTSSTGYKIASPHWINLVNTAKAYYNNKTQNITINDLFN